MFAPVDHELLLDGLFVSLVSFLLISYLKVGSNVKLSLLLLMFVFTFFYSRHPTSFTVIRIILASGGSTVGGGLKGT